MAYNTSDNLHFIKKVSASASTTVDLTSIGSFNTYLIKIRNMVPATAAQTIKFRYFTDGGTTPLSANYKWGQQRGSSNNGTGNNKSNSDSSISILGVPQNVSNDVCPIDIMIYNANSANVCTCWWYFADYNTTPLESILFGGGCNTSTTAVNAFRFFMASGNITSGDFKLYGISDP